MKAPFERLMENGQSFWNDYFALNVGLEEHKRDASASPPAVHGTVRGHPLECTPKKALCNTQPPAEETKSNHKTEIPEENISLSPNIATPSNGPSCLSISVYSAVAIAMVCLFLVIGRDYIKYVLLSLEKNNLFLSLLIFSLLFTVVSFPMTWGYILLNLAAGYLYGVLMGVLIVIVCALFGVITAHLVIQRFLKDFVASRLINDNIRAIMRVVESEHGFKVIVLARLTPIPFGLQNALFAMCHISFFRYLFASIIGMLPTQGLHAYIGSTLRSMEEVISSGSSSNTAYFVFGGQLLMVVALLLFVVRKARLEFNKTVQEADREPLDKLINRFDEEPMTKVTMPDSNGNGHCYPVGGKPDTQLTSCSRTEGKFRYWNFISENRNRLCSS